MKALRKLKKFLAGLGPGFITGASDDDPAGIATYSQTGALFCYQQLWTAPFSFPFMTAVQEMSGRIGIVTGRGLAALIRTHYPRPILWGAIATLLLTNTITIGANLGAMASSARLLVDIPFVALLLGMTALTLAMEIFVSYRAYVRVLKYLALSLLAYIFTAFVVKQDWAAIAVATVVPTLSLSREYLLNIVAILGTTISPYLFFWQASEEVEEEVENHKLQRMNWGRPHITMRDIRKMRRDTTIGMFISNFVMFFIIVATASTLGAAGLHNIQTADQAANALKPLAGDMAAALFALGIVGTGLLAIPVLAGSASYAVAEMFKWREGLYMKVQKAHGFYGVITIATLLGLMINFSPIPPFRLLYFTAVLNGFAAPPIIFLMLVIANNPKIMGKYTNSRFSNILGGGITVIMTAAALMLATSLLGWW
jgi:NRAMP (natural resistance-associated macrophage protein)-like metal ion transporter